ncbi:MAG: hypothetical protein QN120_13655 [Armatimonadota bacterium]|nr:hypothetical protein [Armatimonadota bacterium]
MVVEPPGRGRHHRRAAVVVGAALAGALAAASGAAPLAGGGPAPCTIVEGRGIGALRLGMALSEALAVAGPPVRQHTSEHETIYDLLAPWWQLVLRGGAVWQLSTRSSQCRTGRGIGPGAPASRVREAYAGAPASVVTPQADGDLLSYPFGGIAFLLRGGRVEAVTVFPPEDLPRSQPVPSPTVSPIPGPTPSAPAPAPTTASGTWSIRTVSARVEDSTLVVTGVVENRSRTRSAYAEVRAFGPGGQPLGQADAPLVPIPVPSGGIATFEVRLPVADIVRRYAVVIRPAGSITGSLAERTGEIVRELQQFATLVARLIRVEIQTTSTPPTRDTFMAVVTNTSTLLVASVTVAADLTVTCRVFASLPPLPPSPRPVQELRTGSAVVLQLRPGATGRVPLPISPGLCVEFETWSAQTRVGEVRIATGD